MTATKSDPKIIISDTANKDNYARFRSAGGQSKLWLMPPIAGLRDVCRLGSGARKLNEAHNHD